MPYAYPHSFSERDKIRNDEKTESLKYNKKGKIMNTDCVIFTADIMQFFISNSVLIQKTI